MPCTFQDEWLSKEDYGEWLARDPNDNSRAKCVLCMKTFDISSMGASALTSHRKGAKHKSKVQSRLTCLLSFAPASSTASSSSSSASSSGDTSTASSTISRPVTNKELKSADIWGALNCIDSGHSFSSCNNNAFVNAQQFPDSAIAKQYTFGETKCMYTLNYGIVPYCQKLLRERIHGEPYVLMFDESPNKRLQKKQMDILIRFWDCGHIKSRFMQSTFMGHGRAVDLLKELQGSIESLLLDPKDLLQLSMDGPNVNLSLQEKMNTFLQESNKKLIDIGTCGLHILHNGFKKGNRSIQSFVYIRWDIVVKK